MASMKTCPHETKAKIDDEGRYQGGARLLLSGTLLRKLMSEGKPVPPEFSKPEVIAVLKEYYDGLETKLEVKLHGAATGEAALRRPGPPGSSRPSVNAGHRPVDVLRAVRRRQLDADARETLRHHREEEALHVDTLVEQRSREALGERGVVGGEAREHDRHDRVDTGLISNPATVIRSRKAFVFASSRSRSSVLAVSSSSARSVAPTTAGASEFEKR